MLNAREELNPDHDASLTGESVASASEAAPAAEPQHEAPTRAQIETPSEPQAAAPAPEAPQAPAPVAHDAQPASEASAPREIIIGPAVDEAPAHGQPPRLDLTPYIAFERSEARSAAPAASRFANFNLSGARLGMIAASLALLGLVATAGVYDRARQNSLLVAQRNDNDALAQSIKSLKSKLESIEATKAHDESADLHKSIAELKAGLASGRDLNTGIGQVNARLDRLDHDHSARLDKLTERLDHEQAARNADLVARLEKLEKKAATPVAALTPPTPPPAPAPVVAAVAKPAAVAPAANAPASINLLNRPAASAAPGVSKETTGSIERPRTPIRNWSVVEVHDGVAVVEGREGFREVTEGDVLPGAGRIERIERHGREWAIVTNMGVIGAAGDSPPPY